MVRHSVAYRKLVTDGLRPGRFINVAAAEYLSGLPIGWTSPWPRRVDPQHVFRQFPDEVGSIAMLSFDYIRNFHCRAMTNHLCNGQSIVLLTVVDGGEWTIGVNKQDGTN